MTNDLSVLPPILAAAVAGLMLGVFISQLLGRGNRAKADEEIVRLSAIRLELTTANGVLEQRLTGQQVQYEGQLKLMQDAKQTFGQEFENLANRIFEDKQSKFAQQNKEALEVTLSPLLRAPMTKRMPTAISWSARSANCKNRRFRFQPML